MKMSLAHADSPKGLLDSEVAHRHDTSAQFAMRIGFALAVFRVVVAQRDSELASELREKIVGHASKAQIPKRRMSALLSDPDQLFSEEADWVDKLYPRSFSNASTSRSPWGSGSFYLVAALLLLAALGIVATYAPWVTLPFVFIAFILVVIVVGALQLRNDDRFAEESFTSLMGTVIKSLFLLRSTRSSRDDE